MEGKFEVTFLGTGGSCAYVSSRRIKYGGNTPCIVVKAGLETLIFDAGSGICGFGDLNEYQSEHLHVFFSHYHVDHVHGLLFFSQMFDAKKRIDLYGVGNMKGNLCDNVNNFLSPPFHPVGIETFKAKCNFNTILEEEYIILSDSVTVHTYGLSHPGGSIGYRIEYGEKALCYCSDVELSKHKDDLGLLKFIQNSDLLILDAYFNDENIIPGWGHSSWREAAEWAKCADVKKMALFHYKYSISDSDIDGMEENARNIFPEAFASSDFMRIEL